MKMDFKTIKDKNSYDYHFQHYDIAGIDPDFFPKLHRTFTVAFLNSDKELKGIGIVNSLYDFVNCIQHNLEMLEKKDLKYFAFHYQSAAGQPHFISEDNLKDFEADYTIYYDPGRNIINLNPKK